MPRVYPKTSDTETVECSCCGCEVECGNAACTTAARYTSDGISEWTCAACVDGPGDPDFPGEDR